MWQKFKKVLKCCNNERMTSELLRTIELHINIDNAGGGFSGFLTFDIMSTIVVP